MGDPGPGATAAGTTEGQERGIVTASAEMSLLRSPRRAGAYIGHLGVIMTFVAIAVSSRSR